MIAIDPINNGNSHVFFNTALLSSLSKSREIIFIGEKKHVTAVKLVVNSLITNPIRTQRFIPKTLYCLLVLCRIAAFRKKRLLFLCIDNSIIPLGLLFLFPFLFRCRLSIIIHNNILTLQESTLKNILHSFVVSLYRADICVLTKNMKKHYDRAFPRVPCRFIPHPNYTSLIKYRKVQTQVSPGEKYIAILGRQAKLLAKTLISLPLDRYENLRFVLVRPDLQDVEINDKVFTINRKLSFDEYYSLLEDVDYALFSDDPSADFRASGILMDCISVRCPIIAPPSGHFKEYLKYGIGHFYSNVDELNTIFELIDKSSSCKIDFQGYFADALKYSSIDDRSLSL